MCSSSTLIRVRAWSGRLCARRRNGFGKCSEGHDDSWPKLTGGKGVHVMVPIEHSMTHDQAHAYCKRLAERLTATAPDRYTTSAALAQRPAKGLASGQTCSNRVSWAG